VPHLRDGFIVDKVGHRAKRDPFSSRTRIKPQQSISPSGGRLFAMPQAPSDLLNEKLESVATDIEAIENLIVSEPLQTTDQLLALRTVQELYRRLADDLRVAISLFE
jgi:hypothetical protein